MVATVRRRVTTAITSGNRRKKAESRRLTQVGVSTARYLNVRTADIFRIEAARPIDSRKPSKSITNQCPTKRAAYQPYESVNFQKSIQRQPSTRYASNMGDSAIEHI